MIFYNESGWDFDFSAAARAVKFDKDNALSNRMTKGVDFIVEDIVDDKARRIYIEVKTFDVAHFNWRNNNRCKYPNCENEHAVLPVLVRKCRDTWLCEYLAGADPEIPTIYIALLTVPGMRNYFRSFSLDLNRYLPVRGQGDTWFRDIVLKAQVMDVPEWNSRFLKYPITKH